MRRFRTPIFVAVAGYYFDMEHKPTDKDGFPAGYTWHWDTVIIQ